MTVPEEEIRALPHRTLIVHGREDKVIPLSNSYKLLELLDNADLVGVLALRALVDDRATATTSTGRSATSSSATKRHGRTWTPR